MDDSASLSSLNSADFILVGKEQPRLKVAAGGGSADLENNMAEILKESSEQSPTNESHPDSLTMSRSDQSLPRTPIEEDLGMIKQQQQRPDLTNSVLFNGVTYLGSASISAPRSEDELNRNMAILNEQSKMAIEVTLCVPDNADGVVRLLDPQTELEIISYRVPQILFCARGPPNTPLACCWAFTTSRVTTSTVQPTSHPNDIGKVQQELLYQCQVFRCDIPEANLNIAFIYRILLSFSNAFRRPGSQIPAPANQSSASISRRTTSLIGQAIQATVAQLQQQTSSSGQTSSSSSSLASQQQNPQRPSDGPIRFRSYFDIKEETIDNKGNVSFTSVPRPEKNVFRLRKDARKSVSVALQQIRGFPLNIERCFGMLLAQGRNVRASDMQLLDLESMGKSEDGRYYMVRGNWDPSSRGFKELIHLNEETPKGARVFLTIALDLVISGIQEPVRFAVEAKARVCVSNSKGDILSQDISDTIWSSFKKLTPFVEEFEMLLKEAAPRNPSASSTPDETYEVVLLESKSEGERRAKMRQSAATAVDDDDDEPMVSGFGHVSKECDEEVLGNWSDLLSKWRKNYAERPRGLQTLVRRGIPEALRGEVWQLLAGSADDETEMINTYRLLLTKESSCERVILNDLNRTFPAHEYFKDAGGIGQEALYKLSRAYSVRDEEVGYCQGLSFVIATLLIHMPEEQAFMLLCKLMEDQRYLLREMYKANFENLQMRFHQLTCLIQDNLPDVYAHFDDLKVECHMYASQWFLTLFTAKFPLYLVFRIMDIFLYEGFNSLFGVALALLKCSQKDLLSLDFEGVMRFFRVNLPKKYRSEDHADELIQAACAMKINLKKLKRYEKDYYLRRAEEEQGDMPLQRLEADNKRLTELCMRSELENEMLALELVNDRVKLKGNLDQAEDRIETLTRELQATRSIGKDSEQHTMRLNEELENIREAFRRTCDELQQTQKIVSDYKKICSQLNGQLDRRRERYRNRIESIQSRCCETCRPLVNAVVSPASSSASSPERETVDDEMEDDLPSISSIPAAVSDRLRQVEIELAEKKLALTQALCENQELAHQLRQSSSVVSDADSNSIASTRSSHTNHSSGVSWLSKTVNTIKEAASATNRAKVN